MSEIAASVVLYNTPKSQLTHFLDCIARSSVHVEMFLIDNSPFPLELPSLRPGITYIKAKGNKGYGAGHNIALRATIDRAKYHFVMNSDISFESTELEKMIQFIDGDPAIGQLMPRIVYPDGRLQYLCKLLPTPVDLLLRRFSFGPFKKVALRSATRFELQCTDYDHVMDVPYLSGCFMLFRTSALQQIGLFDERFFMYPEDLDITRRMHARFRTVFYPGATVTHNHARASYKSARSLWIHFYNMAKYFNKWGWIWDPERSRVNRRVLEQNRKTVQPISGSDEGCR